jgi:hypothetical protein
MSKKILELIEEIKPLKMDILNTKDFNRTRREFKIDHLKQIDFECVIDSDKPHWPPFEFDSNIKNIFNYALINYQNYYLLLEINASNPSLAKALKANTQEQIYQCLIQESEDLDRIFSDNAFHYSQLLPHWEKYFLDKTITENKNEKTALKLKI